MIFFLEKYKKNISRVICGIMALVMALVFPLETYADTVQVDSITSLPVDIDVEVENTSDTLLFTYQDTTYDIDKTRSLLVDVDGTLMLPYSINSDGSITYVESPYKLSNSSGNWYYYPITFFDSYYSLNGSIPKSVPNTSFWFSPSENVVYFFLGAYYVDSCFGNYVNGYMNSSLYFYNSRLVFIYQLDLSTMDFSFCGSQSNSCIASIYRITDSGRELHALPSDMICLYSTKDISGFYEPDTSNVYTPDYYFKYQYLFYNDGYGYTFIDSACPISDITEENTGSSTVVFSEQCNAFIYTSTNGIDWILYSDRYDIMVRKQTCPYDCFYGQPTYTWTAVLVYTTDENYGTEPLIPPEYGGITDVVDSLYKIVVNNDSSSSQYIEANERYDSWFVDFLSPFWQGALSYMGVDYSSYDLHQFLDEMVAADYQERLSQSLTFDYITFKDFVYELDSDGNYTGNYTVNSYSKMSVYGYVKSIYKTLYNTNIYLNSLNSGMSSLFDAVTYNNSYMEKLYNSLSGMPLTLSTGLSSLNDSVLGLGTKLDSVFGGISSGNSKLDSILSAINNLDLSVPSSGSGGISTDSEYQSILAGYISSIDANVNSIRNWTVAGTVSDWLFDNSEDADSDGDGIVDKYSSLLTSVVGSSVVSTYLTGSLDKIKSWELGFGSVSKLNEGVDLIVSNLGYYNALIFLPPALGLVNLVMRKERLS